MNNRLAALSAKALRPLYERTSLHRNVIDEVPGVDLREAYAHCRRITREYARTFYLASRFLPYHKQRSIFAIYALCRYLDNLVDNAENLINGSKVPSDQVDSMLEEWKVNLQRTYNGEQSDHPVLLAFSDVLLRHDIPITLPFELIDGVCMDLYKNRYETFDELREYSYKVASIVGLMISEIFGYCDREALQYAEKLGIAMQLTNILRDVGEDLDKDRIYLPAEEMQRFGVTEEDLFNRRMTSEFVALMKFQIERARYYYQQSDQGIGMLSSDSQIPVFLARYNYARILDRIENIDYQVFSQRVYLSLPGKIAILPRAWWHYVRSGNRKSFKNCL